MTELTSTENSPSDEKGQIHPDVLQNIPVTLSIEVGRAVIKIRDLLRLTQGSVVELDRIAGEPWTCWSTTPWSPRARWCWSTSAMASASHAWCPLPSDWTTSEPMARV